MRIIDLVKMGLRNLLRRKARTILTVVGVVIGTISIVVMVSVGIGMNARFTEKVMENGSLTTITVEKYAETQNEKGETVDFQEQKLNDELADSFRLLEHVVAVSPMRYCWEGELTCGKYQGWMNMMVMDFDCFESLGYPTLEDGTYPDEDDQQTFLIGQNALQEFYYWAGQYPKTKDVDLKRDKVSLTFNSYPTNEKKRPFSVMLSKNYKYLMTDEYSEYGYYIYVDDDYFKEIYTKYADTLKLEDRKKAVEAIDEYEAMYLTVDNMDNVTAVQDIITELGYKSKSEMQSIEPMQETSEMLQLVLGAIGLVAMLVSAINIANTMIMSIYERTKEIGIMKVLGCYVRDIKKLFLFEAGMLGLIGGIIGIIFSYVASWAINTYGSELFGSLLSIGTEAAPVVEEGAEVAEAVVASISIIPFWLPFLAALFGMAVGVVSGFFPARRATKISAIEAMKTES